MFQKHEAVQIMLFRELSGFYRDSPGGAFYLPTVSTPNSLPGAQTSKPSCYFYEITTGTAPNGLAVTNSLFVKA